MNKTPSLTLRRSHSSLLGTTLGEKNPNANNRAQKPPPKLCFHVHTTRGKEPQPDHTHLA